MTQVLFLSATLFLATALAASLSVSAEDEAQGDYPGEIAEEWAINLLN